MCDVVCPNRNASSNDKPVVRFPPTTRIEPCLPRVIPPSTHHPPRHNEIASKPPQAPNNITAVRALLCRTYVQPGDDGQPRWECSADLPSDASLGPVQVSCEGFDSPEDPYVLVGSCSLSYSLDAVGPG